MEISLVAFYKDMKYNKTKICLWSWKASKFKRVILKHACQKKKKKCEPYSKQAFSLFGILALQRLEFGRNFFVSSYPKPSGTFRTLNSPETFNTLELVYVHFWFPENLFFSMTLALYCAIFQHLKRDICTYIPSYQRDTINGLLWIC